MGLLVYDYILKCAANWTVRRTQKAMTGNADLVAAEDATRVGLVFVNASGQVTVDTSSAVASGIGFDVSVAGGKAMYLSADFLPLVQAEWWAIGSIGTPLVVFEIVPKR